VRTGRRARAFHCNAEAGGSVKLEVVAARGRCRDGGARRHAEAGDEDKRQMIRHLLHSLSPGEYKGRTYLYLRDQPQELAHRPVGGRA
jgi:hypothetical protein